MTDLTQKVKYEVVVELDQLNTLKTALDAAEKAAKDLGTALDKLAGSNVKGLKSLSGTISSIGTRLGTFSKAVDPSVEAFGRLRTAIEKVGPATDTSMKKAARATKEHSVALVESVGAAQKAEWGHNHFTMRMLKIYGTFHAVRYTLVNAFAAIKEGAAQVDLDNTLTRQFANFNEQISKAQALTSGTVGKGQLTKSFALMSSFGIPMDQFAENMELVQKMAVRTGQSADFLADSFARGISRLSPLILDNLGLQVDLSDANEVYARSVGKSVESMTKQERVGALLNAVLEQMREKTAGVTLAFDSASAAVARAEAGWDNFWLGVKKLAGEGFAAWDEALSGGARDALSFSSAVERLGQGMAGETGDQLATYAKMIAGLGDTVADTLERWDMFGKKGFFSMGNHPEQLAEDIDRISLAFEKLRLFQLTRPVGPGLADDLSLAMEATRGVESAALEAGVPFLVWRERLGQVNLAMEAFVAKNQTALGVQGAQEARTRAIAELTKAYQTEFERVRQLSDEHNVSLGVGLATWFRLDDAVKTALENVEKWLVVTDKTVAQNQMIEGMWSFWEKHTAALIVSQERMTELSSGKLLIDLDIAEAEKERLHWLKQIETVNKDIIDSGMTEERRKQRLEAQTHLLRLGNINAAFRAQKAADEAALAIYKDKTNQQIEADAKRLDVVALSLRAMNEALKSVNPEQYAKTLEIVKDLENRIATIRGMKNKGGGGGAGPRAEAEAPWKADQSFWDEGQLAAWTAPNAIFDRFREETEKLRLARSELKRALTEDPTGQEAADAYAGIMRQFSELSDEYGAVYTTNVLTILLGEDFMPDIIRARDEVDKLTESFDRMIKVADGLRETSTLLGEFRKGMSSFHGDLFGGEFISMIDDLAGGFEGLADVIQKNAEATDKSHNAYNGILGSLPIMRAFTQNLIKDRRDQAKVEMLMQAAAAWAAFAIPDIPKAIAHTTAAAMYAAVGFGAVKLPSGKAKSTTPRESRNGGGGESKRPDIHIHIAGSVVQTEAERGVMAQAAIQEARRRGML